MGMLGMLLGSADAPGVQRIRHEPRRRALKVASSERVTPGTLRLTLSGVDLADFDSLGFDDHLKVFVPGSGERRDYTVRRFDAAAGLLAIDFAIREDGVVTDWALGARRGDRVEIGGPKSSTVISKGVARWLLIGDESALPAIGRFVEEASTAIEVTTFGVVTGPEMRQDRQSSAELTSRWAQRPLAAAADPAPLVGLVRDADIGPDTFVWWPRRQGSRARSAIIS